MNLTGKGRGKLARACGGFGFQNVVPEATEGELSQTAYGLLILHYQHGRSTAGLVRRVRIGACRVRGRVDPGQIDPEGSPFAHTALHFNPSTALTYDPVNSRQSQSDPLPLLLSRE